MIFYTLMMSTLDHFSSIKSVNNIDIIKFENSDIERSQIVKTILEMYE